MNSNRENILRKQEVIFAMGFMNWVLNRKLLKKQFDESNILVMEKVGKRFYPGS